LRYIKDIAIYQNIQYFFDDTTRYIISISKTIYRYFQYIESSLTWTTWQQNSQ